MSEYLLTGAGFSKSFGALLCKELSAEFFNSLIQEKTIQKEFINCQDFQNFEQTLSKIRENHPDKITTFEAILRNIFDKMYSEMTYDHTSPGQSPWQENSVHHFFSKFNCIFTLNQDSFSKKCGDHYPNKSFSHQRNTEILSLKDGNRLPYIELHGAYDWEGIFIIGSNKEEEIEKHPQIKKFHSFFEKCLSQENQKLVVIGYSFCDLHINKIISKGIEHGLDIFIWDPGVENLLDGLQSSCNIGGFADATKEYHYRGIERDNLKKSLLGYLPKNFSLIGRDKESVYKFLSS